MSQESYDPVNRPEHYASLSIEPINVIESWALNYNLGNCIKYISRLNRKHPEKAIEELSKARWYLDREISKLTGQEVI